MNDIEDKPLIAATEMGDGAAERFRETREIQRNRLRLRKIEKQKGLGNRNFVLN